MFVPACIYSVCVCVCVCVHQQKRSHDDLYVSQGLGCFNPYNAPFKDRFHASYYCLKMLLLCEFFTKKTLKLLLSELPFPLSCAAFNCKIYECKAPYNKSQHMMFINISLIKKCHKRSISSPSLLPGFESIHFISAGARRRERPGPVPFVLIGCSRYDG